MADTATAQAPVFEDIAMDIPEGGDYEVMPAGAYPARLVGFTTVEKPEWKLKGEDGEDAKQWKWTFEITDPEWQGKRLDNYTSRGFHPKSNAHKHAAALLGVAELQPGMGSTGQLAGKPCQLVIIEKTTQKGDVRNYINGVLPAQRPRHRPAQPRVTLPGGPPASSFAPDEEEIGF